MVDHPVKKERISSKHIAEIRSRVTQTGSLVKLGTHIKVEPGVNWSADIEKNTIIYSPLLPGLETREITAEEMLFLIAHEGGHLVHSEKWEYPRTVEPEKFNRFLNYFEDVRMEARMMEDYGGFKGLRDSVVPGMIDGMHRTVPVDKYPLPDQVGLSMICEYLGVDPLPVSKECREFLDKSMDDLKKIIDTSPGTLVLSRRLFDVWEALNHDDTKKASEEAGDAADGNKDDRKDGNAVGGGRSSLGGNKQQGGAGSLASDIRQQNKGMDAETKAARAATGDREAAESDTQSAIWHDKQHQNQEKKTLEAQMGAGTGQGGRTYTGGKTRHWQQYVDLTRVESNKLYRKLITTLRHNKQGAWEEGLKRGRLHSRRARKVMTGNTNIFRQPLRIGQSDYTFGLLMDVSGSMSHEFNNIAKIMALFGTAFERAGIKSFMILWDDSIVQGGGKTVNQRYKQRGDNMINALFGAGGGTTEFLALWAAERQFRQLPPDTEKVLITVTDGHTASVAESQSVLAKLHEEGVHCIGIGFNMPAPEHYDQGFEVRNTAELADVLVKIVNTTVRRGKV